MKWLLLLLCLSASAQPFNAVTGLPFLAPNAVSSAAPLLPAGMSHRWKSSDLTNSPVTDWVDEIQAYHMVPFSGSTQPTLDECGVEFWGTNRMTMTNITFDAAHDAFLCVFQLRDLVGPYDISVAWSSGGEIFINYQSGNFYPGTVAATTDRYGWLLAGVSGSNHPLYTNGVLAANAGPSVNQMNNIGAGATGSPGGTTQQGSQSTVKEIILWTNITLFSATQISNINYYVTNTYQRCIPFPASDHILARFKASDITSGIGNEVTNWVDEIVPADFYVPAADSHGPILSSCGAEFYSTNRMVGSNSVSIDLGFFAPDACLVIAKMRTTTGQQALIGNTDSPGTALLYQNGGNLTIPGGTIPLTTTTTDFLFNGKTGSTYPFYTNGVIAYNGSSSWGTKGDPSFGGAGVGVFYGASTFLADMTLKEIIVWTNIGSFSSVDVSNIHYYATNTYPPCPTPPPLLPDGMLIRLKSSDLATNVAVSAWTDDVHGFVWTNSTGATQPTNSSLGVWFTLGNKLSLTNNAPAYDGTQQVFAVFNYNSTIGYGPLLGYSGNEANLGILIAPSGFGVQVSLPSVVDAYFSKPDIGANSWHDVIAVGGANPIQAYTNGVASLTFNSPGGWQINWLGVNQNGTTGDRYQGYLRELILWTNPTAFTAIQVSNLHYYATNTYNYSP